MILTQFKSTLFISLVATGLTLATAQAHADTPPIPFGPTWKPFHFKLINRTQKSTLFLHTQIPGNCEDNNNDDEPPSPRVLNYVIIKPSASYSETIYSRCHFTVLVLNDNLEQLGSFVSHSEISNGVDKEYVNQCQTEKKYSINAPNGNVVEFKEGGISNCHGQTVA